jgi:hypothetical protein
MSLGVAALVVSAGLLLASVPATRPQPAPVSLASASDCPYADRLVLAAADQVGRA